METLELLPGQPRPCLANVCLLLQAIPGLGAFALFIYFLRYTLLCCLGCFTRLLSFLQLFFFSAQAAHSPMASLPKMAGGASVQSRTVAGVLGDDGLLIGLQLGAGEGSQALLGQQKDKQKAEGG